MDFVCSRLGLHERESAEIRKATTSSCEAAKSVISEDWLNALYQGISALIIII